VFARGGLVGDPPPVAEPAAARRHPLAVLTTVDEDGVAWLRDGGGAADRPERAVLRAVSGVEAGHGDVEHGCHCVSTFMG